MGVNVALSNMFRAPEYRSAAPLCLDCRWRETWGRGDQLRKFKLFDDIHCPRRHSAHRFSRWPRPCIGWRNVRRAEGRRTQTCATNILRGNLFDQSWVITWGAWAFKRTRCL